MIGGGSLSGHDRSDQLFQFFAPGLAWLVAGDGFDAKPFGRGNAFLEVEIGYRLKAGHLGQSVFIDDALHAVRKLAADAQLFANSEASKVCEFQTASVASGRA